MDFCFSLNDDALHYDFLSYKKLLLLEVINSQTIYNYILSSLQNDPFLSLIN